MDRDRLPRASDSSGGPWNAALLRAVAMIAFSYLAFVLIPNSILGYLTTRLRPNWRDLVVVAWWGLSFLVGCALFARMSRAGKAQG
jgi:uncharacterized membrane protein